jgi:WD40 repeat protein
VRVWDTVNGKCLHVLKSHAGRVRSVAFSPVFQQLACACNDAIVRVWDIWYPAFLALVLGQMKKNLLATEIFNLIFEEFLVVYPVIDGPLSELIKPTFVGLVGSV